MINTLLFDLDGTLLQVDTDLFVSKYLQALASKIEGMVDPKLFIDHLLKATDIMIHNGDSRKTNQEVFWEAFLPNIPYESKKLHRVLDEFYEVDFPKLSSVLEKTDDPTDILHSALGKGYEVVIATNPIFPRVAVLDRLRWIDAENLPFRLITTYENMHFSKPYKEYYLEILDKIGRHPRECMMIGNDVDEDMVAGELGIETYLVTDFLLNRNGLDIENYRRGTLQDLKKYISKFKEAIA